MKRITKISGAASILVAAAFGVQAQTSLNEIAFNTDGTINDFLRVLSAPGPLGVTPSAPGVGLGSFDSATGLGTIQYSVTGTGGHSFYSFLDIEADLAAGVFNDTGSAAGSKAAGQHWEVSDYGTPSGFNNFAAGTPADANTLGGVGDVALTLGYNFTLGATDIATIDIISTTTQPGAGTFYLTQMNNNSGAKNYLYSTLDITSQGGNEAPDSGTTATTLVLALLGLAAFKYRFVKA